VRELLQAVFLGAVQGLTEFIPVSSSGHLVLVPHFLGIPRGGLAFDVALHMGTFAAVLLYFWSDLRLMLRAVFGIGDPVLVAYYRRLAALLALASVPIAIVGILLEDVFEATFASPSAAAMFLLVTGALLLAAEAVRARRGGVRSTSPATTEETMIGHDHGDPEGLTLDRVGVRQAVVIGFGQCVALFPGISRSGTTIAAGMIGGLTRPAATRFSFLLALPALAGAFLVKLPDLATGDSVFGPVAIAAGVAAAFASGYLAIRWLIALVARDRLTIFAAYVFVAGLASLIALRLIG
jgi:undecaprenyl-diphosphatase